MRIESTLHALQALAVRQSVSADNIARAYDNTFSPQDTPPKKQDMQVADIRRQHKADAMQALRHARIERTAQQHAQELQNIAEADTTREHVRMLQQQRAYEANAMTIRSQDEALGHVINELV